MSPLAEINYDIPRLRISLSVVLSNEFRRLFVPERREGEINPLSLLTV